MNSKVTLIAALTISCSASFMIGRAWSGADNPSSSGNPEQQLTGPRLQGGNMHGPRTNGQSNARNMGRAASGESWMGGQAGSILSNPDSLARTQAWTQYLRGLSPEEFENAAQGLLQAGMAETRAHELSILMNAWAMQDPLSAMAYADKEDLAVSNRQAVLAGWAGVDPEAAIEWAKNNDKSKYGSPWMLGVINGLAATDPDRATQLMKEMPRSADRRRALAALHSHYLMQGPEAAREWAMSFEDHSLLQDAISKVASSLAITDPKGTADWLLANSDKVPDHAISNVMARMAKSDLQGAIDYFNQIEAGDDYRNYALRGIAMELAKSDPQAALDLLAANSDLDNSQTLMSIATENRKSNPEIARQATAQIQHPTIRSLAEGNLRGGNGNGIIIQSADIGADNSVRISGTVPEDSENSSGGTFTLPGIELPAPASE